MGRPLHCSINHLCRLREYSYDDWRVVYVKNHINQILCDDSDVKSLFPGQVSVDSTDLLLIDYLKQIQSSCNINQATYSFEAFYAEDEVGYELEDKLAPKDEIKAVLKDLQEIAEFCGAGKIKIVSKLNPEDLINGATSSSSLTPEKIDDFYNHGVYVINAGDEELEDLQRGWYDNPKPDKQNPYSWSEFLCRPLPTSNSALLADRYLFQNGSEIECAKQVSTLLNGIIPKHFQGDYHVTILFEVDQLYDKELLKTLKDTSDEWNKADKQFNGIKDPQEKNKAKNAYFQHIKEIKKRRYDTKDKMTKFIKERLGRICQNIISDLSFKNVKLDFIAIKDFGPYSYNRFEEKPLTGWDFFNSKWCELDYFTHDRLVITNYFWISATGALAVVKKDNKTKEVSTRRQHIALYTLFHGVKNKDQKKEYLPYNAMERYLDDLYSLVQLAPENSYCECLRYINSDDKVIDIQYTLLKHNHLFEH